MDAHEPDVRHKDQLHRADDNKFEPKKLREAPYLVKYLLDDPETDVIKVPRHGHHVGRHLELVGLGPAAGSAAVKRKKDQLGCRNKRNRGGKKSERKREIRSKTYSSSGWIR